MSKDNVNTPPPIRIKDIPMRGYKFGLRHELVYQPIPDPDTSGHFMVHDPDLDFTESAKDLSDLEFRVRENLSFLFAEYAFADPSSLTPDAAALRVKLRDLLFFDRQDLQGV